MLRSFEISGFRTFKHLRVPRLGRVNLIVGRNNVGKTMFLEALRLYASGGSARAIRELLFERDEVFTEAWPSEVVEHPVALRYASLFHRDHTDDHPSRLLGRLYLGEIDNYPESLSIFPRLFRRLRRDDSTSYDRYEVATSDDAESDPSLLRGFEIMGRRFKKRLISLDYINAASGPEFLETDEGYPAYVPTGGLHGRHLARWWDIATLRGGEDRVVEFLRLLDPIERVTFIEHPQSRADRIPVVRTQLEAAPIPLKALGDGMAKLFQIGLAIEFSRSQRVSWKDFAVAPGREFVASLRQPTPFLLIDEFENGIHYTVHAELWKAVLRLAELHDIQVFATTHSWDCICGLRDAVAQVPTADAVLVRLEKKDGANKAVVFDQRELDVITRDEIEVR